MPEQLSMFPQRVCDHCKKKRGVCRRNKYLWDGFLDTDTGQYVCWNCKELHYKVKAASPHKNLYSETPVPL